MIKIRKILLTNYLLLIPCFLLVLPGSSSAKDERALPLKEFIQLASKNDTTFETILIDSLKLNYRRDLLLPSADIIMSIKGQYNFYLDQDRNEPEFSLALDKLFPDSGTNITLSYNKTSSPLTSNEDSELQLLISQPIARNAFGKGTRLLDQIIGVENDVLRYQIIEAYEDYLASLTTVYYSWYSAWENLKVGQASYRSSLKLLDNIHERQKQKIALPVDVNKIELQVMGKKENLVVLRELYDSYTNLISKAIRYDSKQPLAPAKPDSPASEIQFNRAYDTFRQTSRTYDILRLLEQQTTLEVKKAADDLLPSTNLLLGYRIEGQDWGINNQEDIAFAGISIEWPLGRTTDTARLRITEIEQKKTALSNQNKYEELHTNLKNINLQIEREKELIRLASRKIKLAGAILKDEAENYSFGKITLNDYIDAVNLVDENRFSHITHSVQLNKLLVEWLRLTDRLVDRDILENNNRL